MRPRPRVVAAGIVLLAALTAGCTAAGGSTADKSPSKSSSPAAPSGYPEMQQKVAAAESALTQADKDAAQDTNR